MPSNDGTTKQDTHKSFPEKIATYLEGDVEKYGNEDAKKLVAKYKELSKDGLSEGDIKKLEQLDKELKGAEYSCMSDGVTLVTQEKGNTETIFVVNGHQTKGGNKGRKF